MPQKTSLRQDLTQRLHQTLSPAQLKFVRLLEMNQPEVEEEVRHELEENPALATAETDGDHNSTDDFNETAEQIQLADYSDDDEIPHSGAGAGRHHDAFDWAEASAQSSPMSLMEYLTAQVNELHRDPAVAATAEYIIGYLDSNGYLSRSLQSIADDVVFTTGADIPMETWQKGLDTVRSLDPAGVGARDLRDCLLIQLRRMPEDTDGNVALAREIVAHYFDIFSLKHFSRLESALGVNSDKLREAVEVIRSLNPKPAADIGEDPMLDRTRHIVADFIVEHADDATVTVTLPNSIPELEIERSFREEPADAAARSFIARRREQAGDFIDMLRLRNETLFNVMSAIVTIQHDFFLSGDESDLRPMVLKDVAALTGYDISVISRATAGKYVATPSGTYPLKFFFNEGVAGSSDDDGGHSTHAILAAIKSAIDNEDHNSPLSDDAIKEILASEGIDIARRTVAKYRERLGIPVARLRKDIR
ncbi:MAG: RNA polymerase factor sigma-54 [Duncaniella sp.]|nr:RNA polymerase factor sigma-54 [Duncaniella sp.]